MPKTEFFHNLPTWFEDQGYYMSGNILYYNSRLTKGLINPQVVAQWGWIPSLTSVIETVREFERRNEKVSNADEREYDEILIHSR